VALPGAGADAYAAVRLPRRRRRAALGGRAAPSLSSGAGRRAGPSRCLPPCCNLARCWLPSFASSLAHCHCRITHTLSTLSGCSRCASAFYHCTAGRIAAHVTARRFALYLSDRLGRLTGLGWDCCLLPRALRHLAFSPARTPPRTHAPAERRLGAARGLTTFILPYRAPRLRKRAAHAHRTAWHSASAVGVNGYAAFSLFGFAYHLPACHDLGRGHRWTDGDVRTEGSRRVLLCLDGRR